MISVRKYSKVFHKISTWCFELAFWLAGAIRLAPSGYHQFGNPPNGFNEVMHKLVKFWMEIWKCYLNWNVSYSKSEMILNACYFWANLVLFWAVSKWTCIPIEELSSWTKKDEKIRIWIRDYTFKKVKFESTKERRDFNFTPPKSESERGPYLICFRSQT